MGDMRRGVSPRGFKCSVEGCGGEAVRSLSAERVKAAGLKVIEGRRAYLCKEHYKEFKKASKKRRLIEEWRRAKP